MAQWPQDEDALVALIKEPPPPGSPYGLPVLGSQKEGHSPVYRHWRFVDRPLLTTLDPACLTIHALFEKSAQKRPHRPCLGSRRWDSTTKTFENKFTWITYEQVAARRKNLGTGIVELHRALGITSEKYGVGLWSQNRTEWQIADLACMSQSHYSVSIYDTLGPDTAENIINHAELACVVTSLAHIPTLFRLAPRLPTLKLVICMDPLEGREKPGDSKRELLQALAANAGIQLHDFEHVEALGAASQQVMRPPHPHDISTINYTSGTTGAPKGVVLTQANAMAGAASARSTFSYHHTDVVLSYLPLAHIFERVFEHTCLSAGSAIGYWRGDVLGLVDDLKILRPTAFISVPRLYNRFGAAIRQNTIEQPGLKGALSRHVINTKMASMKLPIGQATNRHTLYDRIWTSKVSAGLGLDRVHTMVTGAAPLDGTLHQLLRSSLSGNLFQGYGLTETNAVCLVQCPGDFSVGNCGGPHPSLELRLRSVPDMEYLVTDQPNPRGELMIRGHSRFREYYKDPEETAKAIDADGWFISGDIAEVDSMGRFTIIDRRKNVLKLAQGEYISPERLENVLMANSNLIAQAYIHGDSQQAFLVCILGVDPITFAPFASSILRRPVEASNFEGLKAATRNPQVRQAILKRLDDIGKKNKFNSFERVKVCWLELEPFTIENGLLTPTLKLKRPQTAKKYRVILDQLYDEILRTGGVNGQKALL